MIFSQIDSDSIKTRNGPNLVLKQHVWGAPGSYVDALCQIAINDDPTDTNEEDCETAYFANYNVTAIVDASGDLVERYEYTPYGSRTVFRAAGTGDTTLMAAHYLSAPVTISGTDQPYSINDIGHQGLMHDAATGANGTLIYNRNRVLHTVFERFNQQDPLGYPDGFNTYAAYHVMHGMLDPIGLATIDEGEVAKQNGQFILRGEACGEVTITIKGLKLPSSVKTATVQPDANNKWELSLDANRFPLGWRIHIEAKSTTGNDSTEIYLQRYEKPVRRSIVGRLLIAAPGFNPIAPIAAKANFAWYELKASNIQIQGYRRMLQFAQTEASFEPIINKYGRIQGGPVITSEDVGLTKPSGPMIGGAQTSSALYLADQKKWFDTATFRVDYSGVTGFGDRAYGGGVTFVPDPIIAVTRGIKNPLAFTVKVP